MDLAMSQMIAIAGYIPVSVSSLVPKSTVGVSLYVKFDEQEMRLYCDADAVFENGHLDTLQARGLNTLFISSEERGEYQKYLRDNTANIVSDESISVTARFDSLNNIIRDVLATAFNDHDHDLDSTVDQVRNLAEYTVDLIARDDIMAVDLLEVMHHDYQTFTHSANVSYYCVMLAKALQISDPQTMREIATGALLHDLGKLEIPEAILCKPGKLTDCEFDTIKNHPRTGLLSLSDRSDLSFAQLMMVYQHHERLDGGGYPVGTVGDEIHDWAKLCSVVDVFEALTSNRPYRSGLPISTAFSILERDSGRAFDPEMIQCWKSTIR
ncbi:MAG: HD-GYP domain-containing protein (c-di-GMP phosphodiesterase class II) [Planctomycetaceae bacterium]|jgi:HD-GYP domain-containing protein (c-di-GMP phosphodiesterase class II)